MVLVFTTHAMRGAVQAQLIHPNMHLFCSCMHSLCIAIYNIVNILKMRALFLHFKSNLLKLGGDMIFFAVFL